MTQEDIEQLKSLGFNNPDSNKYKDGSNVQTLSFASYNIPNFKEKKFKDWITCGPDNLWPLYLLKLANNCAIHNRILESKVRQVFGEGLTVQDSEDKDQLAKMNEFLKKIKFNKKTLKRIAFDQQLFGYFFLGITWNKARTAIANIYHVDASAIRVGTPNEDREVTHMYYSEDWTQFKKQNFKPEAIAVFDENRRIEENQILMVRGYRPATRFYNLPGYIGCLDAIESYSELGNHILNNVKQGFSPNLNISFNNGQPTEEERETVYRTLNALYKGNGPKFILSFNNSKENATTFDPINTDNMSEVYAGIKEKCQNDIVIGHGLTSPILAGLTIPGQLGGISGEIERASEAFYNYVISPAQIEIEQVLQELLEVNGFNLKVWIKDSQPISYQYDDSTLLNIMTIDELRNKIGLPALSESDRANLGINITQPKTPENTPAVNGATPTEEGMSDETVPVNDNIKNMSAKQHQQMLRIIRQYGKNQITKETATVLLKTGLGLSDEDISSMLPDTEEDMSVQTPGIQPYVKQVESKKKKEND